MNENSTVSIRQCRESDFEAWVALRSALWSHDPEAELRAQAREIMARAGTITFLARFDDGPPVGFAEATLRRDYVNGCSTSPVAFIEGLYVAPDSRRRGIARLLCAAVEDWGVGLGCSEMGSDTYVENTQSQAMHEALGFEEMERVVCYRKVIGANRT